MATLLYQKTDFVIGDLTGNPFVGVEGLSTQPGTLTTFDLRQYRAVIVYFYLGGISGGSSPSIKVSVIHYDSPGKPNSYIPVAQCDSQPLTAAGGTALLLGENGNAVITNTGIAGINAFPIASSYKALFCHLQLNVSGSPTGFNSVAAPNAMRVSMWGLP